MPLVFALAHCPAHGVSVGGNALGGLEEVGASTWPGPISLLWGPPGALAAVIQCTDPGQQPECCSS